MFISETPAKIAQFKSRARSAVANARYHLSIGERQFAAMDLEFAAVCRDKVHQIRARNAAAAMTATEAWNAWIAADNAWHAEIEKAYPRHHAGNVRYSDLGKGAAGSALRAAHDEFLRTGDVWRKFANA